MGTSSSLLIQGTQQMRKNLVDFCYVLTEHKQGETTLGEVGKNECPKSLVI